MSKGEKLAVLKKYFGYDSFREGQEALIDSLLSGRDVLGIMPTGAGKSLCYQVPALMLPGITLVISPLISLMKDQVAALNQAGVHAAYLNSSLTYGQYRKALWYAAQGRYSIIYVAPERLETEEFLDFARNAVISMVAVDEAHCVSQWGQDFRPSYLKIAEFIQKLPARPVVGAFTATATKEVRQDVISLLKLQEPFVVTTGYDRPNLYLGVYSPKDKYAAARSFIERHPGQCGIVYCATRRLVEEVCERLQEEGFSATRYHAGLSDEERRISQEDFTYDRKLIMVATNAFGMGIDKSNVRYVVHYNMPKNLESYYQEAGRCARDGEPGECILLYGGQDVVTNQFLIENSQENEELEEEVRAVVQAKDRERLKKMTWYCFTHHCLRDYILKYFGEQGTHDCGNCSNCLSSFETVEVTRIAGALVGCVSACRQRFGISVILDTVRGADTARIRKYRMNYNLYYGALAGTPEQILRSVLNDLLCQGYLASTDDQYAVLKLTDKSDRISQKGERIFAKLPKEEKELWQRETFAEEKRRADFRGKGRNASLQRPMFDRLKALRSEIAREEKVPPYLIFSDKTLEHMGVLKPKSKEEMLQVTGVGQYKFEKYGRRFLAIFLDKDQVL